MTLLKCTGYCRLQWHLEDMYPEGFNPDFSWDTEIEELPLRYAREKMEDYFKMQFCCQQQAKYVFSDFTEMLNHVALHDKTTARFAMLYRNYIARYKKLLKELAREDCYYLITFTRDPNKGQNKSDDELQTYIQIQAKRKNALHIKKAAFVREHHADGRVHWHVIMITTQPIRRDAFKYYEKLYGKVDFSPARKHKSWDDLLGYINKENDIIPLIDGN